MCLKLKRILSLKSPFLLSDREAKGDFSLEKGIDTIPLAWIIHKPAKNALQNAHKALYYSDLQPLYGGLPL